MTDTSTRLVKIPIAVFSARILHICVAIHSHFEVDNGELQHTWKMPTTTIQAILLRQENPGNPGTLKVEVCQVGDLIKYANKDGSSTQMLKAALADRSGAMAAIVYGHFETMKECCEKRKILKLNGFSFSQDGTAIVISNRTEVSVIEVNMMMLSEEERTNAAERMYSPYVNINDIKNTEKTSKKSRVSLLVNVEKVYPGRGKYPKKAALMDATGSIQLTLWSPHDNIEINAGDSISLRDVKVAEYLGERTLDTIATTLLKIEATTNVGVREVRGRIIGKGRRHQQTTVEFIAADEEEEETFVITANEWIDHSRAELPLDVTVKIENGVIISFLV